MGKSRLLVVEDDIDIGNMLKIYFSGMDFDVDVAVRGSDALEKTKQVLPHLIVLDIMLPDIDGYEVCRNLRTNMRTSHIPVIFLTQKDERSDKLQGLELGADDYITKPFDVDVLIARIKAVLRRQETASDSLQPAQLIEVADLTLDPAAHTVTLAGKNVELSPKEFSLLHALVIEPNRVRSIHDLLAIVWGAEFIGQPQVVYVHIRWLREKLEDNPDHPKRIVTMRGVGYKYVGGE